MERYIITKPPEGFVYYQTWPEYKLPSDFVNGKEVVANVPGVRLGVWPLIIERYFSDTEPQYWLADANKNAPNRIIVWQRIFRRDIPKNWHCPSAKDSYLEGFATLTPTHYSTWSERARKERNKWLKQFKDTKYRVESVSLEDFLEAYKKSNVIQKVHRYYTDSLTKKITLGAEPFIDLRTARSTTSGELVAGIACLNSPTHSASYYHTGFYLESISQDPVMVGLMDDWFSRALEKKQQYLFLGLFKQPHDPEHMRGFSQFKSKFCSEYVSLPPPLIRIAKGRLVGDGLADHNLLSVLRSLV